MLSSVEQEFFFIVLGPVGVILLVSGGVRKL